MKRLQELVRERDRRIAELEGNIQVDHLSQLVGAGIHNQILIPQIEEQKELFYRKDPTFHNEKTLTVYQGGSIETLLCLKNGHLAISGSS